MNEIVVSYNNRKLENNFVGLALRVLQFATWKNTHGGDHVYVLNQKHYGTFEAPNKSFSTFKVSNKSFTYTLKEKERINPCEDPVIDVSVCKLFTT